MKIAFVDIETTGCCMYKHVPIEIGIAVVDCDDKNNIHRYSSCISCDAYDWHLADPYALIVNGFNPQTLWNGKNIKDVAQEIEAFFKYCEILKNKAVFLCQNPSFDRVFFHKILRQDRMDELGMPYHWLDLASMYWAKVVAKKKSIPEEMSLSKDSIANVFGLPKENSPHRAMNGVNHLMLCYEKICSI